jgi:16S rRNA (cytosine1402-N4)-methyltransferase
MANRKRLRAKGKTSPGTHVPVLLNETLRYLDPKPGDIVVDCTLGFGSHAKEFVKRIAPDGIFIGMDIDAVEMEKAKRRITRPDVWAHFVNRNFADIEEAIKEHAPDGCDIILADIGVSSMQVDDPTRGISYKADGPLDMRMDRNSPTTGIDIINSISQADLSKALFEFSDEPDHEIISTMIIGQRAVEPITKTSQLTRLVFNAKGLTERTWKKKQRQQSFGEGHPAARTFQTLRILVNDELASLQKLLDAAPKCLRPGGRFGVISFHSTEDRLVKNAFRDGYKSGIYSQTTYKPFTPKTKELILNSRSASARFRYAVLAEE